MVVCKVVLVLVVGFVLRWNNAIATLTLDLQSNVLLILCFGVYMLDEIAHREGAFNSHQKFLIVTSLWVLLILFLYPVPCGDRQYYTSGIAVVGTVVVLLFYWCELYEVYTIMYISRTQETSTRHEIRVGLALGVIVGLLLLFSMYVHGTGVLLVVLVNFGVDLVVFVSCLVCTITLVLVLGYPCYKQYICNTPEYTYKVAVAKIAVVVVNGTLLLSNNIKTYVSGRGAGVVWLTVTAVVAIMCFIGCVAYEIKTHTGHYERKLVLALMAYLVAVSALLLGLMPCTDSQWMVVTVSVYTGGLILHCTARVVYHYWWQYRGHQVDAKYKARQLRLQCLQPQTRISYSAISPPLN
jgi:hypothetical protein